MSFTTLKLIYKAFYINIKLNDPPCVATNGFVGRWGFYLSCERGRKEKHLQTMPGEAMPMMSQPLGKSRFSSSTVSGLWRLFFASEKLKKNVLCYHLVIH